MPAIIQFVESPTGAPPVRLDINDAVTWFCQDFSAPPPRLRRNESSNSMRDGGIVGSASYENRTLTLELTLLNTSTEDAAATELQKLWRELDRPVNWLKYQREGMTKPVFFRLFRSDASDFEELWTTPVARNITLELLAEPFALGLRETLGPFTVNNDPAAGSNPGYVDISGVVGDVATEAIYWNTSYNRAAALMSVRHGDFSDIRPSFQAEAMTLGTDTTNPGGGPDAAMSGTGVNNFVRTSFSTTAAMSSRLSGSVYSTPFSGQSGTWVIYGAVRRSDATSVMRVGLGPFTGTAPSEFTTLPQSTSRQLVRLGRFSTEGGGNYQARSLTNPNVRIYAERVSGTGTLDWDCLFLIPADSAMLEGRSATTTGNASGNDVFDGIADRTFAISSGGSPVILATELAPISSAGRIPQLMPNVTSRLFFLTSSQWDATGLRVHSKTESNSLTIYYWPRYLHVRPVSS